MTRRVSPYALVPLAAGFLAGCVTRRPETSIPPAEVHATPVWHLAEGDVVRMRVYRQPDLSGDATVGSGGTAFFPGLGRVPVQGLSLDSLEALLNVRYTAVVRDPAVQVTLVRDLVLLGQVRSPGVYGVEPTLTILGLMAKAGGPLSVASTPTVTLLKSDGRRFRLPREARLGTIDVDRTDAIQVTDESFFVRNQSTIGAAALVVTTISTLASIILILTR